MNLEKLLRRLVPGVERTWRGATPTDIAAIEEHTDRELPGVYRWFLETMGESMGALTFPSLDLSARRVLAAYCDDGVAWSARYRLIGWEKDPLMAAHVFYDLDRPVRDDAMVVNGYGAGDIGHATYETFAEMLGWHALVSHRVFTAARRTHGVVLAGSQLDVDALRPALRAIGFVEPIATGKACGLFEREDEALALWLSFHDFPSNLLTFELGTRAEATARRILGELVLQAGVDIEIWPNDR
jgi:hypothetical protein